MAAIGSPFSADYWDLRKIRQLLKKVNRLKEPMRQLTDDQLKGKTAEFKKRLKAGASLDSLMVEATLSSGKLTGGFWECFPMTAR